LDFSGFLGIKKPLKPRFFTTPLDSPDSVTRIS